MQKDLALAGERAWRVEQPEVGGDVPFSGVEGAKAVCRLLRSTGAKAKLVAASRGETQPRAANLHARGRTPNRGVELTVSYR